MKTITECQPLIYGLLMAQAEHRKVRRRRNAQRLRAAMPLVYVMVGLAIVFDAGLMPWDVRFWLIFSPVFVFGEWVLSILSQASHSRPPEESGTSSSAAEAKPSNPNGSTVEGQKRKLAIRRDRSRIENPPLLLSAFQVRTPAMHPPLVQPQTLTSKSARAGRDPFSPGGTATLVRFR